ncbi:hypothetical protein A7982_13503 [Minicystis rosea]|nr:hypothetical protein A7982_13503 [Minicystis rosea]
MKERSATTNAQMIAKAWLDESYRAELTAQGIDVPARPDDLQDAELDAMTDARLPAPPAALTLC